MIKQKGIIFAPLSPLERGDKNERDHSQNKKDKVVRNGI